MKRLAREDYSKLIEPLKEVTINKLFARSVVERKVSGKVFVDDMDTPSTYYVIHPYGMSLLFGSSDNEVFNSSFRDYALNLNQVRGRHEWMQAFPNDWHEVLKELFQDRLITLEENKSKVEAGIVELNTRVNFKFLPDRFRMPVEIDLDPNIKILRTNRQNFREMKGSVVPLHFWDSEDDFVENGVGFSLFYKNELASTAFSSYFHDDKLELGIETFEAYRGRGFAVYVCSALIGYCLENGLEPVWSCNLANMGSYKLAQKIGFSPVLKIPYYRLSN
jgi:RimJ/RimL family protein N-acetyltransferase